MLTKKEKMLVQPFVIQNYKNHRRKVLSAKPAIDFAKPTEQPHVLCKLKKIQKERERMQQIEKENQRLLQKLSQIMQINRLDNYWRAPHPNFLSRVYIKTPRTSKRTQSAPVESSKTEEHSPTVVNRMGSSKSRSCARCPACSNRPVTAIVKIPEERVPFTPPRKQKLPKDPPKIHKCCKFCC